MLLCDEPTSSLDNATEFEVMQHLTGRHGNDKGDECRWRTTVVIAHRLSTVQDADSILVLDAGVVVEEGTHDELLRKEGKYSDLVRQFVQ